MPARTPRFVGPLPLLLAVTTSGGTAVTRSASMGGMGLGGLLAARLARGGALRRPLRAYGIAEIALANENTAVLLEAAEPRSRTTP
jgi:hypothetical protein